MGTNLLSKVKREDDCYLVEYEFNDSVLGGQPKSADLMRKWLLPKIIKETGDETLAEKTVESHIARMMEGGLSEGEAKLEEEEERAWTTFFHDETGPYLGVYQIKASFREMLSSLGITKQKRGLKQTHQHLLWIVACDEKGKPLPGEEGKKVHFYRNGEVIPEVDSYVEMAAHVTTAQGPRSILKRHDCVYDATIRFLVCVPKELKSRDTARITTDVMARVLAYAGNNGLGCSRSQGYGTFEVTRFEKL